MKAYPAGDSSVAVTGEDWLGILNFQLLMPHIDIFKNYTVEERVRLIDSKHHRKYLRLYRIMLGEGSISHSLVLLLKMMLFEMFFILF